MQTNIRVAFKHIDGYYLDKHIQPTYDLFDLITFKNIDEARDFLFNNRFAPVDKGNYEYVGIETTKREVVLDVRIPKGTSEAVSI